LIWGWSQQILTYEARRCWLVTRRLTFYSKHTIRDLAQVNIAPKYIYEPIHFSLSQCGALGSRLLTHTMTMILSLSIPASVRICSELIPLFGTSERQERANSISVRGGSLQSHT